MKFKPQINEAVRCGETSAVSPAEVLSAKGARSLPVSLRVASPEEIATAVQMHTNNLSVLICVALCF